MAIRSDPLSRMLALFTGQDGGGTVVVYSPFGEIPRPIHKSANADIRRCRGLILHSFDGSARNHKAKTGHTVAH